jgi:hypothetical protein
MLAAAIAIGIVLPVGTASAQGMFDFFFGNRRSLPPQTHSYADPYGSPTAPGQPQAPEGSRGSTYCVRLCDGRYFPMQNHSGATPAQMCQAFCPAAKTKTFSGSVINHAVARDGKRYADLENAFVYRDRLIADCTCNGKDPFGLARVQVTSDPTLHPGDVIATDTGLAAVQGTRRTGAQTTSFTPIEGYTGVSEDMRKKLSELKVMPAPPGTPTVIIPTKAPEPVRTAERAPDPARSAQARPRQSFWDFFGFR